MVMSNGHTTTGRSNLTTPIVADHRLGNTRVTKAFKAGRVMSETDAANLTRSIRMATESYADMLQEAIDGQAWIALGYATFTDWFVAYNLHEVRVSSYEGKEIVLKMIGDGKSIKTAARFAGVSVDAAKKAKKEDDAVKEAVKAAASGSTEAAKATGKKAAKKAFTDPSKYQVPASFTGNDIPGLFYSVSYSDGRHLEIPLADKKYKVDKVAKTITLHEGHNKNREVFDLSGDPFRGHTHGAMAYSGPRVTQGQQMAYIISQRELFTASPVEEPKSTNGDDPMEETPEEPAIDGDPMEEEETAIIDGDPMEEPAPITVQDMKGALTGGLSVDAAVTETDTIGVDDNGHLFYKWKPMTKMVDGWKDLERLTFEARDNDAATADGQRLFIEEARSILDRMQAMVDPAPIEPVKRAPRKAPVKRTPARARKAVKS